MKILIIDDDQGWRETVIRFIRRGMGDHLSNLWFYEAGTMQQAISLINSPEAADINITLLDLNLPDSSKEETLAMIPSFPPPVIVTSSDDADETRHKAFAHGARGFFGKGNIRRLLDDIAAVRLQEICKVLPAAI